MAEIEKCVKAGERVLLLTLTKRMAEEISDFLKEKDIKAEYLHSEVKTLARTDILKKLREGEFDVLVGVNLLREGLDLPEVSLVAIMDADKEGFLRSETSLIQTIGRAARNVNGVVLMYADHITGSIKKAISETTRRREIQLNYNRSHGITPQTIRKTITDILPIKEILKLEIQPIPNSMVAFQGLIKDKEREMKEVAKDLNFELAAILRDEIKELNIKLWGMNRPDRLTEIKARKYGKKIKEISKLK
jgi:excinuclease ABC subunit B